VNEPIVTIGRMALECGYQCANTARVGE
jgi:hypothetical protein